MPTKQELQQRDVEHLRGMCLKAGLDASGNKAALIERILTPRELPSEPIPTEPTEPANQGEGTGEGGEGSEESGEAGEGGEGSKEPGED